MFCCQGGDRRLCSYTDADCDGHLDEGKSSSGYAFLLNGVVISWSSKKQACIVYPRWSLSMLHVRLLLMRLYGLKDS